MQGWWQESVVHVQAVSLSVPENVRDYKGAPTRHNLQAVVVNS